MTEAKRKRDREYMRARRAGSADVRQAERDRARDARKRDPLPFMLRGAKHRAAQLGLPFDLTIEWARARWTGRCELTDIPFEGAYVRVGMRSPSIDRRDPSLGYTQGNCRFVLQALNGLKGSGTDDDLLYIARQLLRVRQSQI